MSLVPNGFVVESEARVDDAIHLRVRSRVEAAACPSCGLPSRRVHSRYVRKVADLPSSGCSVHLQVVTRRFCCQAPTCPRRIFAERFEETDLAARSRRTTRLERLVHHLGLALGGRPAAAFARRLMMPVSNDTLLRVVRRRARPRMEPLVVAGIDDWAFRRNHRYGSIVVDLERRHIVALLPDREQATVTAWLAAHPGISVLSRDRGGGYGEAAASALPNALQVADRWHLLENASAAFLDAVRKSMRDIRVAVGATIINPDLLTKAEKLQYQGYLRREEANALIMALAKDGVPIKQIVRRTGRSRGLVRSVIKGQATDVFRVRESTLDAYRSWLEAEWAAGCRKGAELWRRLRAQGFKGSMRVVSEWATRRRRADKVTDKQFHKVPSARTIARLMTRARNHLSKADSVLVTAIETGVAALAEARLLMDRFHKMIRKKIAVDLTSWLNDASKSLLASFASGIANDVKAVRAAITEPWSNGQTEGQVNRLKMVKRQMYGRAKIDLLEARLIGAV
jgi:transposase